MLTNPNVDTIVSILDIENVTLEFDFVNVSGKNPKYFIKIVHLQNEEIKCDLTIFWEDILPTLITDHFFQ